MSVKPSPNITGTSPDSKSVKPKADEIPTVNTMTFRPPEPKDTVRVINAAESDDDGCVKFPVDALPVEAADLVDELTRVTNGSIHSSLTGSIAMGCLSSSTIPNVEIQSTPNSTTRTNLMMTSVANSSSGKSWSYDIIMSTFFRCDASLKEAHESHMTAWQIEDKILEGEINKLQKKGVDSKDDLIEAAQARKDLHKKMRKPRLWCQDVTKAALFDVLSSQESHVISSLSSDAREVIDIITGKHNNGQPDDAPYVCSWSGDPISLDRVTDSRSIEMESPCMSGLWLVQEDKFEELSGNPAFIGSGLFQRLLISNTGSEPLDPIEKEISSEAIQRWGELVAGLLKCFRCSRHSVVLTPSSGARDTLLSYQKGCVSRMRTDLSDIQSIPGKWGENAWRIAGILHCARHKRKAGWIKIEKEIAENAVRLMEFYSEQMFQTVGLVRARKQDTEKDKLKKILSSEKFEGEPVPLGQVRRHHGKRWTDEKLRDLASSYPKEFTCFSEPRPNTQGRTTEKIGLLA